MYLGELIHQSGAPDPNRHGISASQNAKLYFRKTEPSKYQVNLSHKWLEENGFGQFSSFSSLFIEILDSRVVDYQGLTAESNSFFWLYLVCPLYCAALMTSATPCLLNVKSRYPECDEELCSRFGGASNSAKTFAHTVRGNFASDHFKSEQLTRRKRTVQREFGSGRSMT